MDSSLEESTRKLSISGEDATVFSVDDEHSDLDVKTGELVIRAHKSVLRQCPYFAAMIDGNWIESQASSVTLNGYSYKSVRFVIEHLYIPKEAVDQDSDVVELTALSDMLGLHSLLDLVCSTMMTKICHNFHKPCQDCIGGVLSSYQLACTYNLLNLESKCLDWITKHMTKTWNSRSFSNLPEPLQLNCLESAKKSMNVENVVNWMKDCQQVLKMLPSVKWSEPIELLVKQLLNSCMTFLQHHYAEFLKSSKFQLLGQSDTWDISRIETILLDAVTSCSTGLPVEQTCLSYLALENLIQSFDLMNDDQRPDPIFIELVGKLHKAVESRLISRVAMATKCSAWDSLSNEKQTMIMQLGFFDPIDKKSVELLKKPPVVRPRTVLRRPPTANSPRVGTTKPSVNRAKANNPVATSSPRRFRI